MPEHTAEGNKMKQDYTIAELRAEMTALQQVLTMLRWQTRAWACWTPPLCSR